MKALEPRRKLRVRRRTRPKEPASDPDPAPQDAATDADAASAPLVQTAPPEEAVSTDPLSHTGSSEQNAAPTDAAESPDPGADQDPGQPYLFVDLYSLDDGALVGKHPDWHVLANAKSYFGAILKAWDGKSFNDGGWFQKHWPAVRAAAAEKYGNSWFRGAYLFLEFAQSGAEQADAYLRAVDSAGGWGPGDILAIIDAEQGREARPAANGKPAVAAHPNRSASKQQVIDCVTECANRIRDRTGRRVILYGRGLMRDLGINVRMGCDLVWNPAYTPTMVVHGLEAWDLEDVVLWQYCGDGTAVPKPDIFSLLSVAGSAVLSSTVLATAIKTWLQSRHVKITIKILDENKQVTFEGPNLNNSVSDIQKVINNLEKKEAKTQVLYVIAERMDVPMFTADQYKMLHSKF
jgi:GH25 family lysozyme M1 (1,4-beta-N-acetylmuramidase)